MRRRQDGRIWRLAAPLVELYLVCRLGRDGDPLTTTYRAGLGRGAWSRNCRLVNSRTVYTVSGIDKRRLFPRYLQMCSELKNQLKTSRGQLEMLEELRRATVESLTRQAQALPLDSLLQYTQTLLNLLHTKYNLSFEGNSEGDHPLPESRLETGTIEETWDLREPLLRVL